MKHLIKYAAVLALVVVFNRYGVSYALLVVLGVTWLVLVVRQGRTV